MSMRTDDTCGESHWYAIKTKPKCEARAEQSIRTSELETFAPNIYERSPLKMGTQTGYRSVPLFPSYIFARFVAERHSWLIRRTSGVQDLVSFGSSPARIEDEVIALLRAKVSEIGMGGPEPQLVPGERVLIQDGPLRNLVGIFEREMSGSERVAVMLSTIHWRARAVVDLRYVVKASAD